MIRFVWLIALAGSLALLASPAFADPDASARQIEEAVERYLADAKADTSLIGNAGSSGYDSGFWIKGGQFMLRLNLTLQGRYEYFLFDGDVGEVDLGGIGDSGILDIPNYGGGLSGFSLPRATLKFSGFAPCSMRYYAELEFGHHGALSYGIPTAGIQTVGTAANAGVFLANGYEYDIFREGWIEWGMNDMFNFRMGLIRTPNTRQLMVQPELQQFADISMASAVTGLLQPGWTDRNRDYGLMMHGTFGCRNDWEYMAAISNGDGGDHVRNVLNPTTSDNLMYSGRLNYAFLKPIGYTEGATRSYKCTWFGEAGIWGSYYADRMDGPHTNFGNRLMLGADVAMRFDGFSMTSAFTYFDFSGSDLGYPYNDENWTIALCQLGYLIPDTPFELGARYSWYQRNISAGGPIQAGGISPQTHEVGAGLNYYLNGHGNKMQIDCSWYSIEGDGASGGGFFDTYSGVPLGFGASGSHFLFRFQWQLAL